jgi:two-component system CheB/CheR fusion protein
LDLVCCRNVLIYMEGSLQKKLLPLFHYVLNPDGFLFLGTSETIGGFSDRFAPVDSKWRIFRRKADRIGREELPSILLGGARRTGAEKEGYNADKVLDRSEMARRLILRECSLPCVLVNEQHDILYVNSGTDKFLYQPAGEPSLDILKLARPELSYAVNTSLHKAAAEKRTVQRKAVGVKVGDKIEIIDIIVKPVNEETADGRMFLIVFKETAVRADGKERDAQAQSGQEKGSETGVLKQELQSAKEYLQTTIEELETTNEELKSSNEELQSTNEELQSTNEELETSREELQSTNEELRTVNAEHQDKIEQLAQANDDLNNLLASTDIGTIFLDTELRIKRFTPKARQLFRLITSDIGRPLDEIAGNFEYKEVMRDAAGVLRDLRSRETEIEMGDGKWFLLRISPYRTINNVIDGVVITGVDVTDVKDAQSYAESVVETVRQPLLVLDKDLRVTSGNAAFYREFKVSAEKTAGKRIYDLGNRQWDIPKLRELLEDILPKNTSFEDFEVEHEFPHVGKKKVLLNARRIVQRGRQTDRILLAIEDVTKEK